MVGGDNAFAVELEQFRNNSTATFINRFDRFDSGCHNTGVTNHVGVGKVQNDQVKFAKAGEELVRHLKRTHFGLQIVGRDFWRWDQLPLFARKRLFHPAIKEISHMRVFFRFGDAQLRLARHAHQFAEDVFEVFRREDERRRKPNVVLC